jgi:hypothetical protein
MSSPRLGRAPAFAAVLLCCVALPAAFGQACPNPAANFWKRDALPAVPSGLTGVSVIQGLCEGESAGVVFNMPAGMGPQKIDYVTAPWGAAGGVNGFQAVLDLEVWDGVSFSGAVVNMGTRVFSLSQDAGSSMQVASHGLNGLDVSAFNIVVGNAAATGVPATKKFAICFRVDINLHPTGSCASGWPANFFTDNASPPFGGCNAAITPQKTSIIEIAGQGWRDAALATVSGFPLCPFFYSGVWCIRACSTDAAPPNPFQITALTPLPAVDPGTVVLQLVGPGIVGYQYVAALSLATAPPIPTPYGDVPLAYDALMAFSLDPFQSAGYLIGFSGVLNPSPVNASTGVGTAIINLPAGLGSGSFYIGFIAFPFGNPNAPWAISDPFEVAFL